MFAVLFRHYNEDINLMRKWIFNKKTDATKKQRQKLYSIPER